MQPFQVNYNAERKIKSMSLLNGYIISKDAQGNQITRKLMLRQQTALGQEEQVLLLFEPTNLTLLSAFKTKMTSQAYNEYCWNNHDAQSVFQILSQCLGAVAKCKLLKNGKVPKKSKVQVNSSISAYGIVLNYSGKVKAYEFAISKQQSSSTYTTVDITGDDASRIVLQLEASMDTINNVNNLIGQVPFVETLTQDKTKIADVNATEDEEEDLMKRHVRTIDEISLSKDTTWLKDRQYYVVNSEVIAEQIFVALESYDGLVSYDVETSGLNINRFCEIGSPFKKRLEEYNESVPKDQRIKADSLTGFSFCIQPNVAYYFPCQHRKFRNLYEDKTEETTRRTLERIKSRYVIGDLRDDDSYIAEYIRTTDQNEWPSDVILMERVRDILEKHKILAHHGSFEYKVGMCYHIDTNLVEDTMIIHQLAFKWKNIRTHAGEPSNLKYLTKTLLGIDQLSLEDFFADFKEAETASEVRSVSMTAKKKKKKKKALIDFSYMEYEGTRCYAPADVDFTLQIWTKLKVEMNRLFPDLEYLYGAEIILACAVGYAEFYGLHINEKKIDAAKYGSLVKMAKMEHKIREYNNLCSEPENEAYAQLMALDTETTDRELLDEKLEQLSTIIELAGNLKLSSPGQVGELLYNKYGWKADEDGKKSMGKKVIKQYEKLTDEEGNPLYPEVLWYRDWKDESTLITKFFDKLQDFMYPGGYLFTSFGQIACATGRMSSKKPNFQQMPGSITKIIEPSEGFVFFDGDFSQIEYRVLCAMAGEQSLIEAFSDPDMDYHQKMAALMFGVPYALVADSMRKQAKAFNFGIPYGMGFPSLSIQLFGNKNKASIEATKLKYEDYFKDQPLVRQFFVDVKEKTRYNEFSRTHFGRRRYFKFTDDTGNINQAFLASALRQAGNAVIQGCLDGSTRIQTKELGIVKIKDVVNKTLHVWDGKAWTLGDIMPSGLKQKCIITFNNGQKFICSPDHKFLVRSRKGNERFVRCEDLTSSAVNRANPHRVVINRQYTSSDHTYTSDHSHYASVGNGANNVFLDDVNDSFKMGVILGRLASDGTIALRDNGGNYVTQLIAEHEQNIAPILMEYMSTLNCEYKERSVRPDRNEQVNHLRVGSASLANEIADLNIKYELHDKIFADTEMLRGFLRGMFDGDGGISGKTIALVFGKQFNFDAYSHDIQKALQFFGIRSHVRYYEGDRTVVQIKTQDNQKFLDTIGFINEEKQKKGQELTYKLDEHVFGQCLIVEDVEITDEYIPMYDVCNTERGYYVADGIITHNTARDIYGIAVARTFQAIRNNKLLGKIRMNNFIHDEVLYEIDARINVHAAVGLIIEMMQVEIPGFPKFIIGGGIGDSWKNAKGSMNEIHPTLGARIEAEYKQGFVPTEFDGTVDSVYKYFNSRVYNFRIEKAATYIAQVEYDLRTGKTLEAVDPAIGKLLNLQFQSNCAELVEERKKAYKTACINKGVEPDKEQLGKIDMLLVPFRLMQFIKDFPEQVKDALIKLGFTFSEDSSLDNLMIFGALANVYSINIADEEEDVAYNEDDPEEDDFFDYEFEMIDENSELYGVSVIDIAKQFGLAIIPSRGVCCIYIGDKTQKQIQTLAELFDAHQCDEEDEGAMRVELVRGDNYVLRPDIWVSGLTSDDVVERIAS